MVANQTTALLAPLDSKNSITFTWPLADAHIKRTPNIVQRGYLFNETEKKHLLRGIK